MSGPGGGAPSARVEVLGPLRLVVDGLEVDVPGPKRRALLALLARAAGRAVAVDDLLDALWPGELPDAAPASLQSHVSRLRRHLGAAATSLERAGGGYRLAVPTDVARAEELLALAKRSASPEARLAALDEARSLWRGEPLGEFGDCAPLASWAVALGELRRAIDDAAVTAALEAGTPADAVATATERVLADPLSEPATLALMRALEAAGRPADALRAGYDHRRRVRAETGLDPSPALAELEGRIASSGAPRTGAVTRPADRLRGRDSELAALRRLVGTERLVTIVGPGGVGKTRLALELAADVDPVTAVLLAEVTDATSIPRVLADALDLQVLHDDVLRACEALLGAGPHLLLVDNCEHVLDGVAGIVDRLLDACPGLGIVATSRQPLGLRVEQLLRIGPLNVGSSLSAGDVERAPAVALFVDRARRVRPDLEVGPAELRTISDIVRRLDGLPLAIELAAGRLSALGLGDLHERLDQALDLLGADGTLRRAIAWSYELLPPSAQQLFRAIGSFPGGVDLSSAEVVGERLGLPSTAGQLALLADASMLEVAAGPRARYRMLDTVRRFALEEQRGRGEAEAADETFLRWALDLAEWVRVTADSPEESEADRRVRGELPNLRAAWHRLRNEGRVGDAVAFACDLADMAGWRDLTEIWAWVLELADDPLVATHPRAAEVLGNAAAMAWSRGELDRGEDLARRGLATDPESWLCSSSLALVALSRGELAVALEQGARAGRRGTGTEPSLGVAALAAAYLGDLEEAASLLDEQRNRSAAPTVAAFAAYIDGEIASLRGAHAEAARLYEQAIERSAPVGSTFLQGIAHVGLLAAYERSGDLRRALVGYRDLIEYWERTGAWVQQWTTLRNLARLLEGQGDADAAARLLLAASVAPDAPPDPGDAEVLARLEPAAVARARRAAAGRDRVLDGARAAIAAALGE